MVVQLPADAPNITFDPPVDTFIQQRASKTLTILSGLNNSGKSYLLVKVAHKLGEKGTYYGCNRLFSLDHLQSMNLNKDYQLDVFNNFRQHVERGTSNVEITSQQFENVFRGLSDGQRFKLFELFRQLMDIEISLQHVERDNCLTPAYLEVDGEPLRYTSTGTRLLLGILATCMDTRYEHVFIDEPEMGLSPKIQSIMARFFRDEAQRKQFVPHLKNIYIATHSHLFLDSGVLGNNFVVSKLSRVIRAKPVSSIAEYQHLQFTLLGNDLESLFLPSAIVIVEGPSDDDFFKTVFRLRFPNKRITVIWGGGDGEIPKQLNSLMNAFGALERSPYRDRIFPVLDLENSTKLSRLVQMGIDATNITVWSQNGIEFCYPAEIMKSVFLCDDAELAKITSTKNEISCDGKTMKKTELAKLVCSTLTTQSVYHTEFEALMQKIDSVVN